MDATDSSTKPKRVAGGIVIGGKKKRRRVVSAASASTASSGSIPSILKSVPPRIAKDTSSSNVAAAATATAKDDNEFDEFLLSNDDEIPSDVLLCLQSYTQSSAGMTAESCAYCPIFDTNNEAGSSSNNNKVRTHLAPFLPKSVLLHVLDTDSSSSSSRMQTEQDIKSLASENKIQLLQLHGTAITTSTVKPSSSFKESKVESTKFTNSGVTGLRGDGIDDDDIAVMEMIAFGVAVKMALLSHASTLSQEQKQTFDVDAICEWFLKQLLPHYAGKTWISSSHLNSFIQSNRVKEYWSVERMTKVIHELTLAGLFLPRRGLGGSSGMEGYWFCLPGLGQVSKSIADGRVAMLRKLRSCKYQEKKRSILEREHGQFKDGCDDNRDATDDGWGASINKTRIQQSGRFVVLDLLAKGLVVLKKTSSGEHFIALPK